VDEDFKRRVINQIKKTGYSNGEIPIPFMGGRPEREVGQKGFIRKEDIINLKIALNSAKTLEEFINIV